MDQYPLPEPGTVEEQLTALGITLRPCPSWCAGDHFGPQPMTVYPEDGFFHDGPEITMTDDSAALCDGNHTVALQLGLASWTPTLAAAPGPAHVRISDGGDGLYFFTPDGARSLAAALTRLADQADQRSGRAPDP